MLARQEPCRYISRPRIQRTFTGVHTMGEKRNIYDSANRYVAHYEEQGRRLALYKNSTLLGYYDKESNKTYDAANRYIGSGNQLQSLLP
jgi:hypothetical protein